MKNTINFKRVVLGGVVSALTLFLINGFGNAVLFRSHFESWMNTVGSLSHPLVVFI